MTIRGVNVLSQPGGELFSVIFGVFLILVKLSFYYRISTECQNLKQEFLALSIMPITTVYSTVHQYSE